MESTYSHLKDSDHIREAREAFDLETDSHESELTPEVCPKCGESPPEDARLCPWCGLAFTPDAKEAAEDVDEVVKQSLPDIDPADMEAMEALQLIQRIREENPGVKEMLAEYEMDE